MKNFLFTLGILALLLSACAPAEPNDFPPAPPTASPTHIPVDPPVIHPTEIPTLPANPAPADANLYIVTEGGFTLWIPAGWSVNGPLAMNGYNLYLFGVDPTSSGGPDSGQIIIADANNFTIEQFAQQLCSTCPANPVEDAIVGGLPAKRTFIGGGSAPVAEWHFVTHDGKLIGFSFRPAGDAPADWVIGTVKFDESSVNIPNKQWITYWDTYYGYGIAIPCWWVVNPTGDHGGAMSIRSYDEAFFTTHSTKGEWTNMITPAGAVKMDIAMDERIDPNIGTEELIRQITPSENEIVSMSEVDLNGHTGYLVEFKSTMTDPVTYFKAYYLRFQSDKLMTIASYPNESLDSSDVLGVVYSIAFNDTEAINLPTFAPSAPLIALPPGCQAP